MVATREKERERRTREMLQTPRWTSSRLVGLNKTGFLREHGC